MSARCALVTGSSKGIGRAIAARLAKDGWQVIVHYAHDEAAAAETARALGANCAGVLRANLEDVEHADELVEQAAALGDLCALVNNAGIYGPLDFLGSSATEFRDAFARTFRINFESPLQLIRAACQRFASSGGGKVLNVASRVGHRGEAGASAYSSSKAALINLTRALAVEHAGINIQHFGIAPGWVETALARQGMGDRLPKILSEIPVGRMASPEDCAAVAAFLLSDEAAYLTGVVIDVNGASYLR